MFLIDLGILKVMGILVVRSIAHALHQARYRVAEMQRHRIVACLLHILQDRAICPIYPIALWRLREVNDSMRQRQITFGLSQEMQRLLRGNTHARALADPPCRYPRPPSESLVAPHTVDLHHRRAFVRASTMHHQDRYHAPTYATPRSHRSAIRPTYRRRHVAARRHPAHPGVPRDVDHRHRFRRRRRRLPGH